METEKMIDWAEKIPIEELFNEIRKVTGLNDLKFTHKIYERNNYVTIEFSSQDLVDKVGFLKVLFSSIVISQFNSEVKVKPDSENKLFYWGTADFRYNHTYGGSNGKTFMTFRYDDKSGWEFRLGD